MHRWKNRQVDKQIMIYRWIDRYTVPNTWSNGNWVGGFSDPKTSKDKIHQTSGRLVLSIQSWNDASQVIALIWVLLSFGPSDLE